MKIQGTLIFLFIWWGCTKTVAPPTPAFNPNQPVLRIGNSNVTYYDYTPVPTTANNGYITFEGHDANNGLLKIRIPDTTSGTFVLNDTNRVDWYPDGYMPFFTTSVCTGTLVIDSLNPSNNLRHGHFSFTVTNPYNQTRTAEGYFRNL